MHYGGMTGWYGCVAQLAEMQLVRLKHIDPLKETSCQNRYLLIRWYDLERSIAVAEVRKCKAE